MLEFVLFAHLLLLLLRLLRIQSLQLASPLLEPMRMTRVPGSNARRLAIALMLP